MKKILLFLFFSIVLAGCSDTISANKAEQIAIQAAIDEGYTNPRLFTEYGIQTESGYHYSKSDNKDVEVWKVVLITDDRPYVIGMLGDLIYYVNMETGEIVDKISGVD